MTLGVSDMEQLDLNKLRLLMQVVECGSLGRAEKKLGIPKASLSRNLKQFEAQLNLKLVNRDQQGISLTDIGRRLVAQSSHLIKELDQIQDMLAGFNDQPKGL
ncbi:MAG: LysR family transcriptional regulator [Pseudomonadales bacterium]|nr:LysR family transcriptional regulator [Pseudomonadales bacterium]